MVRLRELGQEWAVDCNMYTMVKLCVHVYVCVHMHVHSCL